MVVFQFLGGEVLEGAAAGRARASIRGFTSVVPDGGLLERGGTTKRVPAASLPRRRDRADAAGRARRGGWDRELTARARWTRRRPPPRERAAAQGAGRRRKGPGDGVCAGTINRDGALRVRVAAAARDKATTLVARLMEDAQEAVMAEIARDRLDPWSATIPHQPRRRPACRARTNGFRPTPSEREPSGRDLGRRPAREAERLIRRRHVVRRAGRERRRGRERRIRSAGIARLDLAARPLSGTGGSRRVRWPAGRG